MLNSSWSYMCYIKMLGLVKDGLNGFMSEKALHAMVLGLSDQFEQNRPILPNLTVWPSIQMVLY